MPPHGKTPNSSRRSSLCYLARHWLSPPPSVIQSRLLLSKWSRSLALLPLLSACSMGPQPSSLPSASDCRPRIIASYPTLLTEQDTNQLTEHPYANLRLGMSFRCPT